MWKLRRRWEERYGQPSHGNPLFENQVPEVLYASLGLHLDDSEWERLTDPETAPRDVSKHDPFRPWPHADTDAWAEEVREVLKLRRKHVLL